jgi:hypothetical protein
MTEQRFAELYGELARKVCFDPRHEIRMDKDRNGWNWVVVDTNAGRGERSWRLGGEEGYDEATDALADATACYLAAKESK